MERKNFLKMTTLFSGLAFSMFALNGCRPDNPNKQETKVPATNPIVSTLRHPDVNPTQYGFVIPSHTSTSDRTENTTDERKFIDIVTIEITGYSRAAVRTAPSSDALQLTQGVTQELVWAFDGDEVMVYEIRDNYALVKTLDGSYEGWVSSLTIPQETRNSVPESTPEA